MPTIDQYDTTDAYLRLLLQGPPGSGKTTLACQFPRAWVFDCDLNLRGPLQWLRENKRDLPLGYNTIDRDESGNAVPENMRWQRLWTCLSEVGKRAGTDDIRTLVFDSMSKIAEYNKAHVLRTNPTKSGNMEMPSWGFFYSNWIALVGAVTAAKVHCVFIAHDKIDKDELDGSTKIMLNVQGQFQAQAGALFTDVWHAEVRNAGGMPPKYVWEIRTIQDYKHHGLKNSFGLPPVFEFNWPLIEAKLKGEAK